MEKISNVNRRDYTEIIEVIEKTINATVNGKVRAMSESLTLHLEQDREWKIGDKQWKEKIDKKMEELKPIRDGVITIRNVRRWVIYVSGFVASVVIIIGAFISLYKFLW